MAASPKVECPDCGISIETKNLSKHYRKMHPDLDPRRRMRETRVDRPSRSIQEMPRSTVAGIFVAMFVLFILIAGALFFLSFFQDGDSKPDGPEKIWYTSGDGAVINGTYYQAQSSGRPTIYLVHDLGADRTVWNDYAVELQEEDYNVLTIDLRGHGESTKNVKTSGITYDWTEMTHEDLMGIQLDIQGAYRWVHADNDEGKKNTDAGADGAMVGVGRGGLYGLSQISKMSRERMMSAAIISPLLDVYSLDVEQIFEDYGDVRPVMMAASEGDTIANLAIDTIMTRKEMDDETNGLVYSVPGTKAGMPLFQNDGLKLAILELFEQGWSTNPP